MRSDMVGMDEILGDDLMGHDEILGDDIDSLLGAEGFVGDDYDEYDDDDLGAWYSIGRGNKKSRNRKAIQALINKRIAAGSIVKDTSPTKTREFVVGFDVTTIAAGATEDITKRPQVLFRPERIIIPSNVGLDFVVTDVKVGKNSQFTASGEVPAVVFSEGSFGVRLKMDTCQVSMDLILRVRNTSANSRAFSAAVIGPAVE